MSLLLDALKPTESRSAAATETHDEPPAHDEPLGHEEALARDEPLAHEEPLDALETLALLSAKPAANPPLALEPAAETAMISPAAAAQEPLVETVRTPPPTSARVPEPAMPPPSAAPSPAVRVLDAAPAAVHPATRYRLLLALLLALAGIAAAVMFLWKPSTKTFSYPQRAEAPQPQAIADTTPTPSSTSAVQVSSERPTDQFAYQGYAPEINVQDSGAPPSAAVSEAPRHALGTAAKTPRAAVPTLTVTRSVGLSPIDRHVQTGYRALAAGDMATAKNEYLAALALDPNNVDGLMGAATVAARNGQPAAAAAAYAKVLALEPGNPDATAAAAMLHHDRAASASDESHLKILIAADGDRPALHAALAGVYAADARWTEAAQEYFTALGKDPGNPDLAFNLAASLDQNRKAAMALKFYQQALVFSGQRPAQIDLHALEQRIRQLNLRVAAKSSGVVETP